MITETLFDTLDGRPVYKYTLTDKISVEAVTVGATLVTLKVPDKSGVLVDVLLAKNTAREIAETPSYMGSVVGRCANRIAEGKFTLDGKTYLLAKNADGRTHLHGGKFGFNRKIFAARTEGDSLYFSAVSPDGEENYPGKLTFTVKYTVKGSALTIEYFAESDADTVFNPTNHAYFNLDGEGSGSALGNVLQLNAAKFLPMGVDFVPTGEERFVSGTPFDFSSPKSIGRDIFSSDEQLSLAGGYDHNFCLDATHFATAFSQKTGIVMDCYTDMPGVQLYTGNFLNERGKHQYYKHGGFCLETQFFPNAVNVPKWKSPVLHAGQKFYSKTQYIFSAVCYNISNFGKNQ
ncbi:MAG: galactose mutarotase [Corallococcus sp.]|nr:galactose mutarotase [Corallococcus sp.]MCM1359777.1 galactose mutarotase [Corallococcus sp.]MCM1395697.1 galactose mutarotase [Corallococcus sp.]